MGVLVCGWQSLKTKNFVHCRENGKSEFRALIKHSFLRKKTITETKAKLDKCYGDSAPSMVKKWFTVFRCGRTSTIDAECSGRPVEVAIPETIEKNPQYGVGRSESESVEIVEAIGISHGSEVSILKDHLGMSYPQDWCRVCSQSTINAIVWQLRSNVWRYSTAIRTSFCADL